MYFVRGSSTHNLFFYNQNILEIDLQRPQYEWPFLTYIFVHTHRERVTIMITVATYTQINSDLTKYQKVKKYSKNNNEILSIQWLTSQTLSFVLTGCFAGRPVLRKEPNKVLRRCVKSTKVPLRRRRLFQVYHSQTC